MDFAPWEFGLRVSIASALVVFTSARQGPFLFPLRAHAARGASPRPHLTASG
jgi:hypothetical protein